VYVQAGIHHLCQVLSDWKSIKAADSLSVASFFDELPYASIYQKRDAAKLQIERLVTCLEAFEKNKNYALIYNSLKQRISMSEFVISDCNCKRGATLVEGEIKWALSAAYRLDHSCKDKCKEGD